MRSVKTFIEPTVILLPYRTEDAIIEMLDPGQRSRTSADDGGASINQSVTMHTDLQADAPSNLPFLIDYRGSAEFSYESAKNKLASLRLGLDDRPRITFVVPGDVAADNVLQLPDGAAVEGKAGELLKIAGCIDLESQLTVGCAGALLKYVQRRRAAAFLPEDQAAHAMFRVAAVEMFSLGGSM